MNAMPAHTWCFPARLDRVVDGDTVDLTLDQGMHGHRVERVRLLGVNAPETKGATKADGDASTWWTIQWFAGLAGDWPLLVRTEKADAFGRYLAKIWRQSDGHCINDDILAAGRAVKFPE